MKKIDPLFRDTEAAGLIGCSVSTIWRMVEKDILRPPIKIGGMSRWPQSEIQAVIDGAKQKRDDDCAAA